MLFGPCDLVNGQHVQLYALALFHLDDVLS